MFQSTRFHRIAVRPGQVTALMSKLVLLFAVIVSAAGSCSVATAQYFGMPGFGYAPPVSVTIGPGPGFGWARPDAYVGPAYYPSPMAVMADHMARRRFEMAERFAARYGYPYGPSYVVVAPIVEVAPVLPMEPAMPLDQADPYGDYDGSGSEPQYGYDPSLDVVPDSGAFARAAERLTSALSQMENGEVWIEYLESNLLAQMASRGQLLSESAMRNLSARYQGVVANPDLNWLRNLDGFDDVMAGLIAITGGGQETGFVPRQPARDDVYSSQRTGQPTVAPEVDAARGNTPAEMEQGAEESTEADSQNGTTQTGQSDKGDSVLTNEDGGGSIEVLPEPATTSM